MVKNLQNTLIRTVLIEKSPFYISIKATDDWDDRQRILVRNCVSIDDFLIGCEKDNIIKDINIFDPLSFYIITQERFFGNILPKKACRKIPRQQ